MKTVTLKDETVADLLAALGAPVVVDPPPVVPPPQPQTVSVPGYSTKVVPVKWETTIGLGYNTRKYGGFHQGEAFVFVVDVPADANSQGKNCSFRISPTDGDGYIQRMLAVSDQPGDFNRTLGAASLVHGQDVRVYFTVGGRAKDRYGRDITSVADLTPGKRYYFTVINRDGSGMDTSPAGKSADINYALTLAT